MNRSSTSPFRGTGATVSRVGGSESTQMLIRSLEQQNTALVEQIGVLKAKGKKMSELQDKIDMILRHNTQLLNENQRLAKLINQKKSEIQIWKNKHDSLLANRSTASDIEIKRLLNQIQKLKEQSLEIEHAKNLQINQLKNQQNLQLQNLKRNNLGSAEKYELQIRKLKQYCDKKDYQISDLKMKIARIGKQTDFQIGKLREQKERLRNDLQFEQAQHRKQIQSLKSKFDYNFHSEIENLKKQHLNQVQTLDYENSKLKQVINSKNLQLQQAIVKQSKMRNHYQDSIELLKKQNTQLKEKLVENQHISDLQLANLREKLDNIKQSELALLKDAHNNELDILNRQIFKLNKFLDSRNIQIQNISKQKNQIRQSFQAELTKARAELEAHVSQYNNLVARHEQELRDCDMDLKLKNEQMREKEDLLISQIEVLKKQKQTSDSLLASREKQLQRQKKQSKQAKSRLQEQLRVTKNTFSQNKEDLQKSLRLSGLDSEDQKRTFELRIDHLQKKISGLEDQVKESSSLIQQLRSNIELLDKENKANQQKIGFLQNTQRQLRNQSKQNFSKWDLKQKELNRLIKQQIQSMERSRNNQVDQLKSIHDNKIRTLKHQIKQLQRQVEEKNRLINGLKAQYEQLHNRFQAIFNQETNRKNLDIKAPGLIPQIIALKSLFDVFLKNKVLEYCS